MFYFAPKVPSPAPGNRAPGLRLGPDARPRAGSPLPAPARPRRPILAGRRPGVQRAGHGSLSSAEKDVPSSRARLSLPSPDRLWQRTAQLGVLVVWTIPIFQKGALSYPTNKRTRDNPPGHLERTPLRAAILTRPAGEAGLGFPARSRALGYRRRRPFLTASRPLSWAPLARRASVLDLRSISSMMPWMWPPEIPWKSMAGGRKGHELSSARHPTISIYTRPGFSAHPREGEGTAEAARWGGVAETDARGQRAKREEERGRRSGNGSARKREKKKGESPSGFLKEMCRKQTNTSGGERRRRRRLLLR